MLAAGVAYFSATFLFAVVLADVFKLYAARARSLAVASCSHSVAMIACSANSPLDWC
jgi:hypothetical protein